MAGSNAGEPSTRLSRRGGWRVAGGVPGVGGCSVERQRAVGGPSGAAGRVWLRPSQQLRPLMGLAASWMGLMGFLVFFCFWFDLPRWAPNCLGK